MKLVICLGKVNLIILILLWRTVVRQMRVEPSLISEGDEGAGEGVSILPLTEEVIQAVDKSDFQVDQFRRQMNCEYTS